ncbi:hypothetical protein NHQ30_002641 [Ciborinia camelliae]|nr:hypothetical protein NHQ30_002641 [Ciborinia camelliae]
MIAAAKRAVTNEGVEIQRICDFQVLDASQLSTLPSSTYTKIFSNAAMHWILRPASTRASFFADIHRLLKPNGLFVFEMGGMGNVAEMRTALLSVVGRRARGGIERVREVDPWFFPDERWMRGVLSEDDSSSDHKNENENEKSQNTNRKWHIENLETEYRPTPADQGGDQRLGPINGETIL